MSEKSIFQKMFLKPGMKVFFGNIPADLEELYAVIPERLVCTSRPESEMDVVSFLVNHQKELERDVPGLRKWLKSTGIIWLCYPKLTSKLKSDLN